MDDVVFIGDPQDVVAFREAGVASYAPPIGALAERVLAERRRAEVLAMTESTFAALPAPLARELREGPWPRVTILPDLTGAHDRRDLRALLRQHTTPARSA